MEAREAKLESRKAEFELEATGMPVPGTGCCHHCRQPGHWADGCPYAIPAKTKAEHEGRIALFVRLFIADEIDPATEKPIDAHAKRRLIEHENSMWRGKAAPERKAG